VVTIDINKAPAAPNTFQSQSSFSQKILNFTFELAQQGQNNQPSTFAGMGNVVNLSGYRARCRITNAGAATGSQAELSVYGLDPTILNQLTTLGMVYGSVAKNSVIVSAGTGLAGGQSSAISATQAPVGGFPVVFGGTISTSFGDYNNQPDVPLRVTATGGLWNALQSVPPTSYNGPASISQIMNKFAQQLGLAFENNGVALTIDNPYYPGTLLQQIYQCAEHVGINAQIVDGGTKLAIWPKPGTRTSQTNIPLISAKTGMVGYPTFAGNGCMIVKTIFNPDIMVFSRVRVESVIDQANKVWNILQMDLALDTLMPDGDWMTIMICGPNNYSASGIPPQVTK